jgi:virulence-associated protein VagC
LNINRDTELTVTTDGDALILRPVRSQVATTQSLRARRGHSRLSRVSQLDDHEELKTTSTLGSRDAETEESV